MLLQACTTNKGKLQEFLRACASAGISDVTISALPGIDSITAPEETGSTFEENASLKARYYSHFTGDYVFADDSGLEVDALRGHPGVRSARYAGEGSGDAANNALLLKNLANSADRAARFVCVIALARHGEVLHTVRGTVEGEILPEARGANGFGYDPLFYYPPFGRTFGEATHEEKFGHSHRGNALRLLFEWIGENRSRL
jgi:XTP/dITP diphosphohydrolase